MVTLTALPPPAGEAPPDGADAEAEVEALDVAELVGDDPELPELELELDDPQPATASTVRARTNSGERFMGGRLPGPRLSIGARRVSRVP